MTAAPRLYSRRAALSAAGCLISSPVTQSRAQLFSDGGQFVELRPKLASPSTKIERIDGEFVSLDAFRGKVVLVNFWATWCPPCRRELTQLDELQQSIGPSPLAIVAVSIDNGGRPTVEAFLKRLEINHLLPYLDAKGRLAKRVGEDTAAPFILYGTPISYLIDRGGLIVGYVKGPMDWGSSEGASLLRRFLAD